MPSEIQRQRLDELSYLWTSGEWGLESHNQSSARVVFVFRDSRPSPKELLAVRALLDRFRDTPMHLLKGEVGSLPEYVAGEFGGIEARRLAESAQQLGLTTRIEDTSHVGYLPVGIEGGALLIEDDELAKLVTDEMRRQGVPIISWIEAD